MNELERKTMKREAKIYEILDRFDAGLERCVHRGEKLTPIRLHLLLHDILFEFPAQYTWWEDERVPCQFCENCVAVFNMYEILWEHFRELATEKEHENTQGMDKRELVMRYVTNAREAEYIDLEAKSGIYKYLYGIGEKEAPDNDKNSN